MHLVQSLTSDEETKAQKRGSVPESQQENQWQDTRSDQAPLGLQSSAPARPCCVNLSVAGSIGNPLWSPLVPLPGLCVHPWLWHTLQLISGTVAISSSVSHL